MYVDRMRLHISINTILDLLLWAAKLFQIVNVHWLLFLPPAIALKVYFLKRNYFIGIYLKKYRRKFEALHRSLSGTPEQKRRKLLS